MATHSRILGSRVPWTEEWWATVHGVAQSWTRLKQFSIALFPPIIIEFRTLELFVFWPHHAACGILFTQPGIKLAPPCSGSAQDHWGSPTRFFNLLQCLQDKTSSFETEPQLHGQIFKKKKS